MAAIVRTWRASGTPEGARRYCDEHFAPTVLPALRTIDRFVSARVLLRDDGERTEVVVETTWASAAALEAFAGEDVERAVVEPVVHELLDEVGERVTHHVVEVDSR